MEIKLAREISARIWCDREMSHAEMDTKLAERIATLIAENISNKPESRPTTVASDFACARCESSVHYYDTGGVHCWFCEPLNR